MKKGARIIPVILLLLISACKERDQIEFESLANTLLHDVLDGSAEKYLQELSTISDMTIQRVLMDMGQRDRFLVPPISQKATSKSY